MQNVKSYTIKNRVPTKVWFILFIIGFLCVFAYFTQPWFATPVNGILMLIIAGFIAIGVWLVTPQFLVGAVLASVIIGVIVARKYIWGTKVKALVPTQPALQQGLQSTTGSMYPSQTATNQDLIIEEDK